MIEKLKFFLPAVLVGALIGAYFTHTYTANGYERKLAELKAEHAAAITSAQQSYKETYEKREKDLIAQYLADRNQQLNRVQQLEAKLRAQPSVATLARERRECFGLVVEGAGLVEEGRRIVEADRGRVDER